VERLKEFNRRTLDVIASRIYFYYSWAYECAGALAEVRRCGTGTWAGGQPEEACKLLVLFKLNTKATMKCVEFGLKGKEGKSEVLHTPVAGADGHPCWKTKLQALGMIGFLERH
jgi:hypothetical protein